MKYFDPLKILHRAGVNPPPQTHFHLAIFAEPFLSCIYSGEKTLESRITRNRIAPWGKVSPGDIVFVKRSSGPVEAFFTAGNVTQFDLAQTPLKQLRDQYSMELCANEAFWQSKQHCRYAVLMQITNLTRILPFSIDKKGMQTWLVL